MSLRRAMFFLLLSISFAFPVNANPLSDPENAATLEESLKWSKEAYRERNPTGTEVYHDPKSGYRAIIKVLAGNPDTIVVAFRGTASAGGIFSDVSLNYPQFQTPEFLHTIRRVKQLLRTRDNNARILATGHSSGGGLAEAFAYEITHRSEGEERKKMKIDLVTWNGIGASDWYEFNNRKFSVNPEVASHVNGIHVRGSKDFVSRLGSHLFGDVWSWNTGTKNFMGAHVLPKTFKEVQDSGLILDKPKEALGILTGPHLSRVTFVTTSRALILTKGLCRAALGARR